MRRLGEWLDARLGLKSAVVATLQHPVPRSSASWFYVFGSGALTILMLQLVTGVPFLVFSGRVVYSHHDVHSCPAALADQARAGALMWFWVTVAYLIPASLVTVDLLAPPSRRAAAPARS